MPHTGRIAVTVIALLLLVAAPARAEEYRDATRHFSVNLPAGWQEMPPNAIAMINQFVRQQMSGMQIRYETGFHLQGGSPSGYPYVLVQVQPTPGGGGSYDEIEREFGKGTKEGVRRAEGALKDIAKNVSVGTPVLDRANNRVVMRTEMEVAGVGKIQGLSVGFLGAKHIVFLHCYALQADYPRRVQTFQALLESFQYEPGYAFVPKAEKSIGRIVGWVGLAVGIIGVVVIGLAVLLYVLLKPKRRRRMA